MFQIKILDHNKFKNIDNLTINYKENSQKSKLDVAC